MKLLTTLYFSLLTICSADFAIIKDKDGFTNVRNKADIQGKVIYKMQQNQVFFYIPRTKSNWYDVSVTKNGSEVSGYMHQSCIMPIESVPEYKGKDFTFAITSIPFKPADHKLERNEDGALIKIDGHDINGTDGNIPKMEVSAITITLKGKKVTVPKALYQDLYEPHKKFTILHDNKYFYVHAYGSDGAGGYEIVWTIDPKGSVSRQVAGF